MRIIDADGHVAENASLTGEALRRWPDRVRLTTRGRPHLMIEGRHYPQDNGPGAGCPPQHGISKAPGINCATADGVLADADRDHLDTMVLYPSVGLCVPSLEDPAFAAGFARLYNEWIADFCAPTNGRLRGVGVTPIEHGQVAIDIMKEANELGLVATLVPPALKSRTLTMLTWIRSTPPPSSRGCRWEFTAPPVCTCPKSAWTASPTTSRCTASASLSTR